MNDEPTVKTDDLQRLAPEALIVAETTVDPNRKRAPSVIALCYKRLAEFARKTEAAGAKAKVPPISN